MCSFSNIKNLLLLIITSIIFIACSKTNFMHMDMASPIALKEMQIHFIDVGEGDSILINVHDGKKILVDAGNSDTGPGLVKYLTSIGVSRIDHLILTHPHDDHIGGVFNILSEFKVGNLYDNGINDFPSTIYEDYVKSVRKEPSKYRVLQAGEQLLFGELKLEVINPRLPLTGDLNEDSIVLRLHYGDVNVLLSGDMGERGERRLMNTGVELNSHILKIGHHGAENACTDDFLAAVGPQAAIISVGKNNIYSRPKAQTLKRLENAGIKIYRTDLNGHITLKTNGKVLSLHTEK